MTSTRSSVPLLGLVALFALPGAAAEGGNSVPAFVSEVEKFLLLAPEDPLAAAYAVLNDTNDEFGIGRFAVLTVLREVGRGEEAMHLLPDIWGTSISVEGRFSQEWVAAALHQGDVEEVLSLIGSGQRVYTAMMWSKSVFRLALESTPLQELAERAEAFPDPATRAIALVALARVAESADAGAILARAETIDLRGKVAAQGSVAASVPFWFAVAHAGLGNEERALAYGQEHQALWSAHFPEPNRALAVTDSPYYAWLWARLGQDRMAMRVVRRATNCNQGGWARFLCKVSEAFGRPQVESEARGQYAAGVAERGELERGLLLATEIPEAEWRRIALAEVMVAAANQGEPALAERALGLLVAESMPQAYWPASLFVALPRLNDLDLALRFAATATDEPTDWYERIALAQVERGDLDGALETLDQIAATKQRRLRYFVSSIADRHRRIAKAGADASFLAALRSRLDEDIPAKERLEALAAIGLAAGVAGKQALARECALAADALLPLPAGVGGLFAPAALYGKLATVFALAGEEEMAYAYVAKALGAATAAKPRSYDRSGALLALGRGVSLGALVLTQEEIEQIGALLPAEDIAEE